MTSSKGKRVPGAAADKAKADRLAAALRANLKRRKAQARAKDDEPPPPDEPAKSGSKTASDIKNA